MSRPWMPLYVADYLADTGHLSVSEHGAYILLIMHYWQSGGLPDDERRIQRITRMTAEQWEESRAALADLFDDGWKHKRIEEELARAGDISSKRSAAAQRMHAKRNANASANADQMQTQPQSQPQEDYTAGAGEPAPKRSRSDLDELEEALRTAAGPILDAASPGLLVLAPILALLAGGCDLELDVLPAVREVAARPSRGPPKRVRSWEFFTAAIQQAHARRTAPLPEVTDDRARNTAASGRTSRPNAFMSRLAEIVVRETQHLGPEIADDPGRPRSDGSAAEGARSVVVQLAAPFGAGGG